MTIVLPNDMEVKFGKVMISYQTDGKLFSVQGICRIAVNEEAPVIKFEKRAQWMVNLLHWKLLVSQQAASPSVISVGWNIEYSTTLSLRVMFMIPVFLRRQLPFVIAEFNL